jgi:hypothetical protein
MSEDIEPVATDTPSVDKDEWKKQYEAQPASDAAAGPNPPLLAASATASDTVTTRPLWLAFLAAAGAALLGALVWAGIVVATGYEIGFVALFIGAATGLTAHRVAGAPVGGFEQGLAGVLAAGSIVVGRYVIFVHEVRTDTFLSSRGISAGYLDTHSMSVFVHNIGTIIHGFDWFWIILAGVAAVRTAGGKAVLGMGRARS